MDIAQILNIFSITKYRLGPDLGITRILLVMTIVLKENDTLSFTMSILPKNYFLLCY